jgi:primosomal protein N' (replication factor Y)
VAAELARRSGALLLLGSATQELDSRYAAEQGRFSLLRLDQRFLGQPLPPVHVVDLREELHAGRRGIFSALLERELEANLRAGEQSILLLNRRGAAAFVLCRSCGYVAKCPACSTAMVLHDLERKVHLRCHWCARTAVVPRPCPECGSAYIKGFGVGTERVEAELRSRFPSARVVRMDRDTTGARDSHATLFGRFARGEADVLVGTQMVAKGFDLPRVSLVGVVSADTALHVPDFRAGEATFQLLTQVAGRAGRGSDPAGYAHGARVIVQTYTPEHYAIGFAAGHDYDGFYAAELAARRDFAFPPFRQLVVLTFSHRQEELARAQAETARQEVVDKIESLAQAGAWDVEVLGPTPAVPARLRGRYRWQLTLKGMDLHPLYRSFKSSWSIDVDPRF